MESKIYFHEFTEGRYTERETNIEKVGWYAEGSKKVWNKKLRMDIWYAEESKKVWNKKLRMDIRYTEESKKVWNKKLRIDMDKLKRTLLGCCANEEEKIDNLEKTNSFTHHMHHWCSFYP
jgi:hypothetical protein